MRTLSLTLIALGILIGARPAVAQFYYPYQSHASTAAEGYSRGIADMVRAAGEATLMTSEAAINVETARSKYLENRLKGTETYFEMRRRNREYREAERGPRASSEQLFRLAHDALPDKLSVSELDPVTGDINWPILLRRDEYGVYRDVMQACFDEWAEAQGNLSSDVYVRIQETGNDMLNLLKSRVRLYMDMGISSSDYLAAKNFLQSLLFHSRAGA